MYTQCPECATVYNADAATIAETLTNIGLEVEEVGNPAEALKPFTIARVLTAERHPQADKLQVLSVDTGSGEPLQVVCGAPNARAGLVGVFGGPGTYVPGSDFTLKKAAIRGVESNGMMCSSRELELGDDHSGIIELAEDAPVGTSFANRKLHLGYRALDNNGCLPFGRHFRGHEFHYSTIDWQGAGVPLFQCQDAAGAPLPPAGLRCGNVMGSYAHIIA